MTIAIVETTPREEEEKRLPSPEYHSLTVRPLLLYIPTIASSPSPEKQSNLVRLNSHETSKTNDAGIGDVLFFGLDIFRASKNNF